MRTALVFALLLTAGPALRAIAQTGDPTAAQAATTVLAIKYGDGRTTHQLVGVRPVRSWTENFVLTRNWQPAAGQLPAKALHFASVLAGANAQVTVSVLMGPERREVPVKTVLVAAGTAVTVSELRTFGIEPIELSLTDVLDAPRPPPLVRSVAPELLVKSVEVLSLPRPGYRITVSNTGAKAVMHLHVQSFIGDRKAVSMLPSGGGRPLIEPGASHRFELLTLGAPEMNSGPWVPPSLDRIDIGLVLWEDGTYEGVPPYRTAGPMVTRDAGGRVQAERVIAVFRESLDGASIPSPADVRTRLESLAAFDPVQPKVVQRSMQMTKAAALEDLRLFQERPGQDAQAFATWLRETMRRYQSLAGIR